MFRNLSKLVGRKGGDNGGHRRSASDGDRGSRSSSKGRNKNRSSSVESKSYPGMETRVEDVPLNFNKSDFFLNMPSLREVPELQKEALFVRKLRLCKVHFNFNTDQESSPEDNAGKEAKRQILLELIDHITGSKGWCTDRTLPEILDTIASNLYRPLPPSPYGENYDPDEDDPVLDPAWPHLQIVHEFLLRFVVSSEPDPKMLKRHIGKYWIWNILQLFRSEDPRERDYLKTTLHRIYGKFMNLRAFIRKSVNNVMYQVIYENARHDGIGELLEILGSIINGFAMPLKDEHVKFLRNVLIPLHKVPTLSQFHQQLVYCVTQFIDKDNSLASVVLGGLIKFWPVISSPKEVIYLNELEELLELTPVNQFAIVHRPLFIKIGKCVCSCHFQVAERALFLWNNEIIMALISAHRETILPLLYPYLQYNINEHWNQQVQSLTTNVLKLFADLDCKLYDKVALDYRKKGNIKQQQAIPDSEQRRIQWVEVREMAANGNPG